LAYTPFSAHPASASPTHKKEVEPTAAELKEAEAAEATGITIPRIFAQVPALPSAQSWKNTDPQDPKSIWYHTDMWGLGFRIIRPAKNPTLEEMHLLWNTGPGKRF
jgi:hypothetical protein